jgi:hypothetical protein
MGGLFSSSVPRTPPPPARPVTAVTKTPDIALDDTELKSTQLKKQKAGKKGLKVELAKDVSTQTGSTAAGLQIPKGS